MQTYMHTDIQTCKHTCILTYKHVYIFMYVHVCAFIYLCMHLYIHTYVYMYIHTNIYMCVGVDTLHYRHYWCADVQQPQHNRGVRRKTHFRSQKRHTHIVKRKFHVKRSLHTVQTKLPFTCRFPAAATRSRGASKKAGSTSDWAAAAPEPAILPDSIILSTGASKSGWFLYVT